MFSIFYLLGNKKELTTVLQAIRSLVWSGDGEVYSLLNRLKLQ